MNLYWVNRIFGKRLSLLMAVVMLAGVMGSVAVTTATATPAAAVTNTCPATNIAGGAPCFPGDVGYVGAWYDCRYGVTGDVWGVTTFHNLRVCMDIMLIKDFGYPPAQLKHIVDLYENWSSAAQVWGMVSAYAKIYMAAMQFFGRVFYDLVRPVICIYLVAQAPEAYQLEAGIGCSYADSMLAQSGY